MNKNFFILIFLVLVLSFVSAGSDVVNYTNQYNFNVDVSGIGLNATQTGTGTSFTFEDGGSLTVGKNKFENIESSRTKVRMIVGSSTTQVKTESFVNVAPTGKIIDADFFVNEDGGNYTINGVNFFAPSNSRVKYSNGQITLVSSDKQELKEFPDVSADDMVKSFKIEGNSISLPNGAVLNKGALTYLGNGKFSIDDVKGATINDVWSGSRGNDPVDVFFDGKKHSGNYISFGEDTLIGDGFLGMEFKSNNKYVKIDQGDLVKILLTPGTFTLKNREKIGQIPKLSIEGDYNIRQDSKDFFIYNNKLFMTSDMHCSKYYTTSPMIIDMKNSKGESTFDIGDGFSGDSKKFNGNLIVDNFNRFAVVSGDSDEYILESQGIDTKFSSKLSYNYFDEKDLNKIAGGKLDVHSASPGYADLAYGRFRDYYEDLPDDTKDSFSKINFVASRSAFGSNGEAYFDPVGESVNFYAKDFSMSLGTFRHELSHAHYHDLLEPKKDDIIDAFEDAYGISYAEAKKKSNSIEDEYAELLDKKNMYRSLDKKAKIQSQIDEIKGERMALKVALKKVRDALESTDYLESEWSDISHSEYKQSGWKHLNYDEFPKNGFARPYGLYSEQEDLATYMEQVNNPDFFKNLINPESPKYDIRYEQKLAFLHKYKFITEKEYSRILEVAGLK